MEIRIQIEEFSSRENLPETDQRLVLEAINAISKAYSPYSGFRVGAAVLLANGAIITGNNQENAAYPAGLCAERVALLYAHSQYPEIAIKSIAVAASSVEGILDDPVYPCGSCRQVILESENRSGSPIRIIMYGQKLIQVATSIKDLLPLQFDSSFLKK